MRAWISLIRSIRNTSPVGSAVNLYAVNIDTDLRMASTGAVRKHLIENTANFDPRKFLKEATNAMSDIYDC
jgi:fructose/tagatose bisphosphate aldolase